MRRCEGVARRPTIWRKYLRAAALAAALATAMGTAHGQQAIHEAAATDPRGDYVDTQGARIWYASVGAGSPVLLLHGGMASSRSWAAQVPALVAAGHRVILVDSRGHGRSTLGPLPLRYDLLADDVLAIIDRLHLERPAIIGWSDGAIVALLVAMRAGPRLRGVYAFGANMDKASVRPDAGAAPILGEVAPRHVADYATLSPTPDGFGRLQKAVRAMQADQQDIGAAQLRTIRTPVTIAGSEQDEFILPAHFRALAEAIPSARLVLFPAAGHFVPWQDPNAFNRTLIKFLARTTKARRKPRRSTLPLHR